MSSAVRPAPWAARGLLRFLVLGLFAAGAAQAAPDAPAVRGLIVQLRDAPTHASLLHERGLRAAALSADAALPLAVREAARWQQMLAAEPSVRLASRRASGIGAQVLQLESPLTREQAQVLADRLAARPEVAWAVPDERERRLQAGAPPSDPYYPGFAQQWWLQLYRGSDGLPINQRLRGVPSFLDAWRVSTGSAASRVAVLDNGITAHPELNGRVLPGYDMVADTAYSNDGTGRDGDPSDPGDWVDTDDRIRDPANYGSCALQSSSWHGTAIAGMLFANTNNGVGVAAMNWQGSVLPVRVAAKCGAAVSDIVDGMLWAAGVAGVCKRSDANGNCEELAPFNPNPARVINISFGGTGSCDRYQPTIDLLRARGVVIVAAAGNEWTAPTRPAKCPGVVGVAALNRDGFKANYSNFGPELSASGIATVGGDDADPDARWSALADGGLLSIGNDGATGPGQPTYDERYVGTSFAAPVVAGAVSLMLSVNPNLSYDQIVEGLRVSARPHVTSDLAGVGTCSSSNPGRCLCTTQTCGVGILDVTQALAYAAGPTTYVPPVRNAERINSAELQAVAALGPDRPANGSPGGGSSGGGGGGTSSPLWLAGLLGAVAALRRARRSA